VSEPIEEAASVEDSPLARPTGRDLVVIGASAGGIEALRDIVQLLPEDLPAAVVVVVHLPPEAKSALPAILARRTLLFTVEAHDRDTIQPGRVYVAPPDKHVLIEDGHLRLSRGPRENGHRPAIDPLFRSAARSYGPRVIGVVLSGNLEDGTVGLGAIEDAGGATVVQDPEDALYPSMPRHAIAYDDPQHVLPASEIAALITHLTSEPIQQMQHPRNSNRQNPAFEDGNLAALSCPECSGPIAELSTTGGEPHFVCRVGHAFAPETLFAQQATALETALWTAVRVLQERGELATRLAERLEDRGANLAARRFRTSAEDSRIQAATIRQVVENLDAFADAESAGADDDELTVAGRE
jgi:two-component system chemotaxis response regulator CheB